MNVRAEVNPDIIRDIILRNYNFHASEIQKLDGYEDLNIKVTFRKGDNNEHLEAPSREYILKILSLARTGRLKVVGKLCRVCSHPL